MALADVFLAPLGLLALAALVPLILLYLVRPDPATVTLPTLRFITAERRQETTNPLLERLRRSLLLLVQALVIVLLASSLATPYVSVSESETVEETVLVVDSSASMATKTGDGTRFQAAVASARSEVTGTTSVVVTAPTAQVAIRQGPRASASGLLDDLSVTDAPGDLSSAIAQASAVAGENAQILVFSDFANEGEWEDAVRTARAEGYRVELRQFAGGGADNVGIVDQTYEGSTVQVSVKNFGAQPVTRTLALDGQQQSVTAAPGDVVTASFDVPPGGGTVRLTPGDSFPVDDTAYVAAPSDAVIDVLLLTNDRNRYLVTALEVVDEVSLTVREPPTAIERDYDVVVFSNVDRDRLLRGNVETAQTVRRNGGGVVVQAQEEFPSIYGDLLLVDPRGIETTPTVRTAQQHPVTDGITFPPPDEYVTGSLRSGETLVSAGDDSPLVAVDESGPGTVLYVGYMEAASTFKFHYQYPVFWKRAMFHLAGRSSLAELNRGTDATLRFGNETAVETPSGRVTATAVPLSEVGFYTVGDRTIAASLLSESESNVAAEALERRAEAGGVSVREEERRVPRPVTEWVLAAALFAMVLELGYLKRRGDL